MFILSPFLGTLYLFKPKLWEAVDWGWASVLD